MYMVVYQKNNGEIFNRIRNTLPHYGLGKYTSMGWKILDIKYNFDGSYYSHREYRELMNNYKNHRLKYKIKRFLKI